MTDDDALLLNAYHDGELSPGEVLAMERRLAADPALRAEAERLQALSGALRTALVVPPASPMLRARVVQQLGFADPPRRDWGAVWRSSTWRPLAAMLLIGLLGGGLIGSGATYLGLSGQDDATLDAVLAGHLRGLAASQPFDIASSNRHVVKPWFNGRTTVAPQAPDFADQGFPLVGGRIDIVNGKAVPTLVYRRDLHVISVTITPRAMGIASREENRDGSTIEHWTAGDLTYWVVSDLEKQELRRFAEMFRAKAGP